MLSTGVDLVEIGRFARALNRWGEALLARLFTPAERVQCRGRVSSLAARFAAKEAVSKALGTGIGAVGWQDIEILADERGAPRVVLHRAAARRAQALGLRQWSLSLSHTETCAVAFVVALGEDGPA